MLINGRFSGLEELILLDEIIRTDKYLSIASQSSGATYVKRDFLFRAGVWREKWQMPGVLAGRFNRSRVLCLGHSDFPTSKHQLILAKCISGVEFIFGTNLPPIPGLSGLLPLGLSNLEHNSPRHEVAADDSLLVAALQKAQPREEFDGTIYCNFTPSTNPGVREPLKQLLAYSGWPVQAPQASADGRASYLRSLRENSLTVCPEGNGKDTHRLWETLYMGGTPVVLADPWMDEFYDRLPLVRLDGWEQLLNRDFIESEWYRVSEFEWDSSLLSASYWTDQIATMGDHR